MSGEILMKTDVVIIGGGPSGLAAAYEVSSRGYKVLLVDESWALGGQLKQQTQVLDFMPDSFQGQRGYQFAESLIKRLEKFPVQNLLKHEVIGLFADGNIGVYDGEKLLKITSSCIIVATGAAESANPFPGWTLPGVMTLGAAQILMNRERVYPGRTAVVIGSSDMALEISRQMVDVGIQVVGVVESTEEIKAKDVNIISAFQETGIPLYLQTEVVSASGSGRVENVFLSSINDRSLETNLSVDLVCIDGGRHPILEAFSILNCEFAYQEELGGWLPCYDDQFQSSVKGVFVAGQAAGVTCQAGIFLTGAIAGISAVDYLEKKTLEERENAKKAYWNELERIENAKTPEVWQGRLSHIAKKGGA
jgi:NADPH-dependent 2,4-dienoyl-CoA reductase/sulfur reductase-like enzyme